MSLDMFIGPMFSGKTTSLLMEITRKNDIGYRTCIISHSYDTRDNAVGNLTTHKNYRGILSDSILQLSTDELSRVESDINDYQVIGIDEAHFFPDLEKVIQWVSLGKQVYIAGLSSNYLGENFGKIYLLIPHADRLTKLTSSCMVCLKEKQMIERPAIYTQRIVLDKSEKLIGGVDMYQSVCREHFWK